MNLGTVDKQYAAIENDPFTSGEIVLRMVIQGRWYRLVFDFDNTRFPCGKVTLPLIRVQEGQPVFVFTVVTDNPVVQFSGDWAIGVDVGINDYATVAVRDIKTGRIVHNRRHMTARTRLQFVSTPGSRTWNSRRLRP